MPHYLRVSLALLAAPLAFAQAPADYYAPASALSGAPLRSALHQVIAFYKQCALDIAAQSVLLACVISMLAQRLGWM